MLKYSKTGKKRLKTQNFKHKKKHPKHEKSMNENFTTTQKYEKYYRDAKNRQH